MERAQSGRVLAIHGPYMEPHLATDKASGEAIQHPF